MFYNYVNIRPQLPKWSVVSLGNILLVDTSSFLEI